MGINKLAIQVNERLNNFRVKIIDIRSKLLPEVGVRITQRMADGCCTTTNRILPSAAKPRIFPSNG